MDIILIALTAGIFASFVLILVTIVFLISQLRTDNGIMDIWYGPIYALAGWATWYVHAVYSEAGFLLLIAISLWATRLCLRITRKNWGAPEDARYAAWRRTWLARGRWYTMLRSYIQVNLLQGIIICLVATPIIIALAEGQKMLGYTFYLGLVVLYFGLIYETIADWQLDRFIARKKAGTETATLMRTGLFAYSRRPNYFGESLIWWGAAIAVVTLPYGYIALISPLLITYIMTKVTGPILERQFLERYPEEYSDYMRSTNYFVPGPKTRKKVDT